MKYGKDTSWLKGIEFGEEPKNLAKEQLVRGYILLSRSRNHIGRDVMGDISVRSDIEPLYYDFNRDLRGFGIEPIFINPFRQGGSIYCLDFLE
jgi:hypothetical protein